MASSNLRRAQHDPQKSGGLVINRKLGEGFKIGEDVVVTLMAIQGNFAKINIKAPKDVKIHRLDNEEYL